MGLVYQCWLKNRGTWQSQHPWLHGGTTQTKTGRRWGSGCLACCTAFGGSGRALASFACRRWPLEASLFQQHEKTRMHRYALGEVKYFVEPAPGIEEFQSALESALRRGAPAPGGTHRRDAGRHKRRKMLYCLAEASRIYL